MHMAEFLICYKIYSYTTAVFVLSGTDIRQSSLYLQNFFCVYKNVGIACKFSSAAAAQISSHFTSLFTQFKGRLENVPFLYSLNPHFHLVLRP